MPTQRRKRITAVKNKLKKAKSIKSQGRTPVLQVPKRRERKRIIRNKFV